jgi:replicative DNA helicase
MDVQYGALARAVLDEDMVVLVKERITADFFPDAKYERIFRYLLTHWNKYGTPPDLDVAKRGFPSQKWEDPGQTIGYFIEELRRRRKMVLLLDTLNDAVGVIQDPDDPDATDTVIGMLQGALHNVRWETSSIKDENVTQQASAMERLLTQRMENPGHLRGLSTGFNGIDLVTGGLQKEQLVTIVGTPKTGKSSALLYMALAVHRQAAVPLFVSFEMSFQEQMDRLASLLSGISLTRIMNGQLTPGEKKKVVKAIKDAESMKPFIISTDILAATTVSGIQMKIHEYQPDVVFIDGTYLMDAETPTFEKGSNFALTEITRGLKRLAQTQNLPIVNTTQALLSRAKKGLSLHSIGYTSSFAQDSDLVLGTERPDDEKVARFHVIASRSGPRGETWIAWDWDHGHVQEVDPSKVRQGQGQQGGTGGGGSAYVSEDEDD